MWFRRAMYWLNGVNRDPIEAAFAELRRHQERLEAQVTRLKVLNDTGLPRIKMWEAAAFANMKFSDRGEGPVLDPTLDDPLQQWLWQRAWNACAETGSWDLLNAVAGIARGIREDGIPLSDSLLGVATRYRGGSE